MAYYIRYKVNTQKMNSDVVPLNFSDIQRHENYFILEKNREYLTEKHWRKLLKKQKNIEITQMGEDGQNGQIFTYNAGKIENIKPIIMDQERIWKELFPPYKREAEAELSYLKFI